MNISIIDIDNIGLHQAALNKHLQSVFNESVCVEINNEFLCALIIEHLGDVIACGFAYQRQMSQGTYSFKAGIIGGIAVHPDYRGQGLCRTTMQTLDNCMLASGVEHSFLFAYTPEIYRSSGYSDLLAPIHYYDKPSKKWNQFVYRGSMVKSHNQRQLPEDPVIEFQGCIY